MKILIINSSGFEEGGVETSIVLLRPLLEKRGHVVKILASDSHPEAQHFNDFSFKRTGSSGITRYLYATLNPHSYFALKKILKEFKPDIVALNTMAQPSPSILFLLKKYPTVLTIHGPEAFTKSLLPWYLPLSDFKDGEYNLKRLRPIGKVRYLWTKYVFGGLYYLGLRDVDQIISVSSYMQRLMAGEGMSTISLPNGTTLLEHRPFEKGSIKNTLAYAGRLEKFKGVDHLIRAMPETLRIFPDAHLSIAGDGAAKGDLVALVKSLGLERNITFLGHLSREDLEQLYRRATIVIMPSIWPEAFGKIGIEAMSVGRPVIATDVGGISDWMVNKETGLLVPPKDPDALSAAIITLLSDRDALIRMGKAGRKRAEKFGLEEYTDRLEQVYAGVIEKYRPKGSGTMNFFYVTDEILDARAVGTIHVDEICKNLVELGHAVTLYAPPALHYRPTGRYGVAFINSLRTHFSFIFQIRLFFRLRRDIAKDRPTVIYSRHSHLLFMPALVAKLFNVPLVLEVNGRLAEEAKQIDHSLVGRMLIASGILKRLESFNVGTATRLVVVTQGIKEYLMTDHHVDSTKIDVVANGVDIDFFRPRPRIDARKELGLEAGALCIGYLGSFYAWQGMRYVMRAAQLVLAQRPSAKFLIVGKGGEESSMKAFIKKERMEHAIIMRPSVPHERIATYINALDICLCYPTKFRSGATSPFKVYEYLACGRAVVVSDIAGMREEFGDVVTYAEPESPELLAQAIVSLIDDGGRRERLGERGRAFVKSGHTWQTIAGQIAEICREAAAVQ